MKALSGLNKEQWAAAGAGALGALLVLLGLAGGAGAKEEGPPRGGDMVHGWPGGRYFELPAEKVEHYWKKKIFTTQSSARLPIPILRPPEPPEEDLAAPLFRPGPSYGAYNRMALPLKYPALAAGAPVVDAALLPPAAEIDALKSLEEPEAKVRPDRRGDREREHFTIRLKTGTQVEGELIADQADSIMIRDRRTNQRVTYKKEMIAPGGIFTNRTFLEVYQQESKRIKGPREAEERTKLAQKLVEWGMLPEAAAELQKVLEARKDHPEAAPLLAQVYQEMGNLDAALGVCLAADLHYETSRCLRAFDLREGELHALELAVQSNPRHHAAKLGLARALLEAGRAADALRMADDFFVKLGRSSDTSDAHRAEGHAIRAVAQLRQGAVEKARPELAEALRLVPGHAEALNANGAALALEGAWQAAGGEFVKAIRAQQYLTEAWTNLGTLCLLAGKAAEAEALFAAAAQRDPRSASALVGQGLALLLGGKDPKAALERALELDPRHPWARLAMGHLQLKEGKDEDALRHFTEALRAEYFFLPAYSGAASAFLRTARKPAGDGATDRRVNAETLLRMVKDFDVERPRGWLALGCVHAILGRADEARQELRHAINRTQAAGRPVEPLALYALGWVEYHHGQAESDEQRLDSSLREFQQAAALKGQVKDASSQQVVAAAEAAVEAIETWKVSVMRIVETFEGPDGRNVSPNWLEAEDRYGVSISLEKGRARFSGRQAVADHGVTQLSRDFDGDGFHALEVTFHPEKAEKVEYGISLFYAQQGESRVGFHVGVDGQGVVRYNPAASDPRDMDKRDMAVGWGQVRTPVPDPKAFRFRLTRGEKNRAQNLTLWFWDAAKTDWVLAQREVPANLGGKGQWRVSVFCRAPVNQEVDLSVDDIRVFARERR